jgi:1,4-dihydroxy-2-naphthoate octaprenyltransferase
MSQSPAMSRAQSLLGPMRPSFLLLTPACVLLGAGAAVHDGGRISLVQALVVLIGAVATHISVNALNEYFDYRSGLDLKTRPTPFSGGSGTLPREPRAAPQALATGLIALAVTASVGAYVFSLRGAGILPLGLAGILIIVVYTVWLTRSSLLCLVAPGLGFGTFMVMGTAFSLNGHYTWTAFVASLVPFFLVNDLLLLNQFPDVDADRSIGRSHYPITIGRPKSSWIYVSFLTLTYLSVVIGVTLRVLPPLSLLGLLTVPLAVRAGRGAVQNANQIEGLLPFLGLNVILNLTTPVLVSLGLLLT